MAANNVGVRDIATAGNLSPKTVSRILSGNGEMHRKETVEKVLALAREMGYRRNLVAKSMSTGKTQLAGVMIYNCEEFFTTVLRGVHDALAESDYLPLLVLPRFQTGLRAGIQRLMEQRVDGIVIRPHPFPYDVYHEAMEINLPLVLVDDEGLAPRNLDFVGTDDILGGKLAAEHLLRLGHRRLGFLTQFAATEGYRVSPLAMRHEGFRKELEKCREASCVYANEPATSLDEHNAALELLSRPDRPTAIFACMDYLAQGVYHAARKLNLRIPEDLSVVGFADLQIARTMFPALTTLRQAPYEIGQRAVHLLLKRINGESPSTEATKIRLRPELIVRESTAPPVCGLERRG